MAEQEDIFSSEDVAGTIAFLAGDEASMLTGSHILITGEAISALRP